MKKIIAACTIVSLLNLAALQAGPIEKKKTFTTQELLELSAQALESREDVEEVEAGFLGAANGLINLALYGAILYGGYKLTEGLRDDD